MWASFVKTKTARVKSSLVSMVRRVCCALALDAKTPEGGVRCLSNTQFTAYDCDWNLGTIWCGPQKLASATSHIVMLINGVVSRLALPWTSLTASFVRLPRKEASGSWPVSRIWGELFVDPSTPTLVLPMLFTKELFMSFSVLFLGVGVSTLCFAVLMPTKLVSGFRMMQR